MQLRLFPDYFPPRIPMFPGAFDYRSSRIRDASSHIVELLGKAGKSQKKEECPDSAQYFH
jgi:hypothetical protein